MYIYIYKVIHKLDPSWCHDSLVTWFLGCQVTSPCPKNHLQELPASDSSIHPSGKFPEMSSCTIVIHCKVQCFLHISLHVILKKKFFCYVFLREPLVQTQRKKNPRPGPCRYPLWVALEGDRRSGEKLFERHKLVLIRTPWNSAVAMRFLRNPETDLIKDVLKISGEKPEPIRNCGEWGLGPSNLRLFREGYRSLGKSNGWCSDWWDSSWFLVLFMFMLLVAWVRNHLPSDKLRWKMAME